MGLLIIFDLDCKSGARKLRFALEIREMLDL